MKEEQRGNITREEQPVLPEESMEQVMDSRETNSIGAEPRDHLDRDEQHHSGESHHVHANSRSPLRADSVPVSAFCDQ